METVEEGWRWRIWKKGNSLERWMNWMEGKRWGGWEGGEEGYIERIVIAMTWPGMKTTWPSCHRFMSQHVDDKYPDPEKKYCSISLSLTSYSSSLSSPTTVKTMSAPTGQDLKHWYWLSAVVMQLSIAVQLHVVHTNPHIRQHRWGSQSEAQSTRNGCPAWHDELTCVLTISQSSCYTSDTMNTVTKPYHTAWSQPVTEANQLQSLEDWWSHPWLSPVIPEYKTE